MVIVKEMAVSCNNGGSARRFNREAFATNQVLVTELDTTRFKQVVQTTTLFTTLDSFTAVNIEQTLHLYVFDRILKYKSQNNFELHVIPSKLI
jgi:hypothetical protein